MFIISLFYNDRCFSYNYVILFYWFLLKIILLYYIKIMAICFNGLALVVRYSWYTYAPWVIRGGKEEGVPLFCEAEHEGLVCWGGTGGENHVVGIEGDLVASNLSHEIYQCLLEGREAMVVLEESQLAEYGFAISLEPGHVRVLCQPWLQEIER